MEIRLNVDQIIASVASGEVVRQVEVEAAIAELNKLHSVLTSIDNGIGGSYREQADEVAQDLELLKGYDRGSYTKEEMELARKEIDRQKGLVRKLEDKLSRTEERMNKMTIDQGNAERLRILEEENKKLRERDIELSWIESPDRMGGQ